MKGTVHYEEKEGIAILSIDNPPVNALSSGVRQGLYDHMTSALNNDAIKAIVITGIGNSFIAGADISEFSGKMEGIPLPEVLKTIENSTKPVIAAINGTALGGGLETALCCDYRIGGSTTVTGLPEIKLGLLPGAGGTQRLPRLIGAESALKVMLTGEHYNADQSLKSGIIDQLVEGNLLEGALEFARTLTEQAPLRKIRDMQVHTLRDRQHPEIFEQARKTASRMARGLQAPEWIIQCVEAAVNLDSFDEGLKKEAENFMKCFRSPQRKALIHVFFNERNAAKIPGIDKSTTRLPIRTTAVIGAGTMGGGIAMSLANASLPVTLLDIDQESIDRGLSVIRSNYLRSVKKGKLSQQQYDERMALIKPTLCYDDLANADLIIEAVYENMELKKSIFRQLDAVAKDQAILATNTSALDIDEIAQATTRPQQVIGTHFFSPANVMKLLEVVRGKETSKEVIATCMTLAKPLKKVAVLAGNCRGFIGNRMIFRYMQQANQLILEGALPEQVDRALYDFGMNMGPFAMHDLVGLDLAWRERQKTGQSTDLDKVADALCEAGRYGQKADKGFYQYDPETRNKRADTEVAHIIEATSAALGMTRREISQDEIIKRCIYALVNEGAKILEEGIAIRSSDIDIVYIYGYGFPAYKGGPMYYADSVGVNQVYQDLLVFQQQWGNEWEPAHLLKQLAETGGKFTQWKRETT